MAQAQAIGIDPDLEAASGTGVYEWRPAEDLLIWSPGLRRIYGQAETPQGEGGFSRFVHPKDRVRVEAETSAFLSSDARSYSHQFRIVRPDGSVRLVLDRGVIERDKMGEVRLIRGVNIDLGETASAPGAELSVEHANLRDAELEALYLDVAAMEVVHPGMGCEVGVAIPTNPDPEPRMNVHKNALMTQKGRVALVKRVREEGWRVAYAAHAAGISVRTAYKWLARFKDGGEAALFDKSSAPRLSPTRIADAAVEAIAVLRRQRLSGVAIAQKLGMARSTVSAVLRRIGLSRLENLDPKPAPIRYQRERPGELIHIDTKKLGKIEGGVGHRITGHHAGMHRSRGVGWEVLHVAIDDASRLAYTLMLPDETKESAIIFLNKALDFFAAHGTTVERVMTDNGSAYRSHAFARILKAKGLRHIRTRPYTPRTNGKAERFIQTSLREWAYARPYQSSRERQSALAPFNDRYNTDRPHSALNQRTPFSTLNNLLGIDT